MGNFIIRFFTFLIYRGTEDADTLQMRKSILTVNRFALITIAAVTASLLLDFNNGFYDIIFMKLVCIVVTPSAIYFNTARYRFIGKYITLTILITFVFYLDNYFGPESGVYFYYFLTAIAIPFVFTSTEKAGFVYSYSLFCLLLVLSIIANHELFVNTSIPLDLKKELHRDNFIIAGAILLFYSYIIVDINTEFEVRLQSEHAKLLESEDQLKKINYSKDRILGIVAHDLRNPINAIQGIVEIIKMDPQNAATPENLKLCCHTISDACAHSIDIINTIIEAENIALGKYEIKRQRLFAKEFIEKLLRRNRFAATQKNIEVHTYIDDVQIYTDPTVLNGVLENLLSNAIKFTDTNGKIFISLKKIDLHIQVEVEDTGIGISEKALPLIFDRFTTAKRAGTEGEKTIGMGLYICKTWVDLLGGIIHVQSEVKKGTKFTVIFPADY